MKIIGLLAALEKTSAKIMPFDKDEWVQVRPEKSTYWKNGFKIPKCLTQTEIIISVPVIHTHSITGVSLSLKNSVGFLDSWSRKKMHFFGHIQERVAELNLVYQVDLVVLDGTRAFISGGPSRGELVEPMTLVVSKSRVQADIAAYQLLIDWGAKLPLPPERHPQIAHAMEIGIK